MVKRTQHEEATQSSPREWIAWRRSAASAKLGLRAGVHRKQESQVAEVSESRGWNLDPPSKGTVRHPGRSENEREAETLLVRLASGDEQALSDLYDGTNRIVYGLALRILGEPSAAEDVTMDVYMQVWRTAGSYEPERGTVLTWLATLVRSRAIDSLRRRKARRAELEDNVDEVVNLSDSRFCPELASLEVGRSRIVREAIDQLSPDQREAIELAYFSGLTHTEAAVQLGLPLGTVKTRIRSGMLQLRKILEAYAGAL
jgi:RNA polymerase sigma-70 factor, ECF subfamily